MIRLSLLLAVALCVFFSTFWYTDGAIYFEGVRAATWLSLGMALYLSLRLVVTWRSRQVDRQAALALTVLAAAAVFVPGTLPLKRAMDRRDVARAVEYPFLVLPHINLYRREHGRFPETLAELPHAPAVPRLLRRTWLDDAVASTTGYLTDGRDYTFTYAMPDTLAVDVCTYRYSTGKWERLQF